MTRFERCARKFVFPSGNLAGLWKNAVGRGPAGDAFDFSTDRSGAGERVELEYLVSQLAPGPGYVVDIAASDGLSQSSTVGLFSSQGWEGLAVEMDPSKFSSLALSYSRMTGTALARMRITPMNIVSTLQAFEVGREFTVLSLDIDSYDLRVLESLLGGGYRPAIITMEINEKIPPGVFFTVEFDENHSWQGDHFYGCSLDAACEVVRPFGYSLHKLQYNNAFFVRSDLSNEGVADLAPELAFELGYKQAPNRSSFFRYNADVDFWLDLEPEDAVRAVTSFFNGYSGKFSIRPTRRT